MCVSHKTFIRVQSTSLREKPQVMSMSVSIPEGFPKSSNTISLVLLSVSDRSLSYRWETARAHLRFVGKDVPGYF